MSMTDPRLIQAVQELDPGTRALLDLSLRRAIPDERVAGLLGVDLAEIPRRRARGIAELADKLAVPGPAELAALLVAIPDLPEDAWGVPNPKLPKVKKVSAARRAKAFRRAAVAASPLVAAAAVLAAVIVSGGSGGQKSANLALSGANAPGKQPPAAVAKAPAKSDARHSLPRGAEVASAEGPSPATITARKAAAARHRRQRARTRRHRQHAVNTIPVSDNFATSAPQPDAYVPPPKPKHKNKPHHNKPKQTQPETPTTTPEVQTPAPTTPQVVATPPTQQVTTTTPDVLPPKQDGYKKPATPVVPVQNPPQQPSGDDNQGDNNGGGCGHGGGDHKSQGDGDHKWQGGDQKSSVFKTRRELSRQRYGWSQD